MSLVPEREEAEAAQELIESEPPPRAEEAEEEEQAAESTEVEAESEPGIDQEEARHGGS